jgi:hypothetical protein
MNEVDETVAKESDADDAKDRVHDVDEAVEVGAEVKIVVDAEAKAARVPPLHAGTEQHPAAMQG